MSALPPYVNKQGDGHRHEEWNGYCYLCGLGYTIGSDFWSDGQSIYPDGYKKYIVVQTIQQAIKVWAPDDEEALKGATRKFNWDANGKVLISQHIRQEDGSVSPEQARQDKAFQFFPSASAYLVPVEKK